jgi:hypothetical protein
MMVQSAAVDGTTTPFAVSVSRSVSRRAVAAATGTGPLPVSCGGVRRQAPAVTIATIATASAAWRRA